MKKATKEDFKNYAKETYGIIIDYIKSDKFDTFESLFKDEGSVKNIEVQDTGINFYDLLDNPCADCPNHPSNGGSGICQCILGTPKIT